MGCGSIGSRRAKILFDMGDEEVWVTDNVREKADFLAEYNDGIGVWDGEEVDSVLVCTPPDDHVTSVIDAVGMGIRGLYVEKPIALTAWDLDKIEAAAREVPVTMGACNLRFMADGMKIDMGPAAWTARMGQHSKYWSPNHRPISMALDSIHDIDLLEHKAGRITRIIGTSYLNDANLKTVHENGSVGHVFLDRTADPPVRFLKVSGLGADGWPLDARWELWPPDPEMYVREMQHWVACVREGVPTCNPLDSAIRLTRMVLEAVG